MRLRQYITEAKIKLKRHGPGNYYAEVGRIYIDVWQTENKKYWGAEITIGDYGDDDYETENFQAITKKDLMMSIETYVKNNSRSINRKPKRTEI